MKLQHTVGEYFYHKNILSEQNEALVIYQLLQDVFGESLKQVVAVAKYSFTEKRFLYDEKNVVHLSLEVLVPFSQEKLAGKEISVSQIPGEIVKKYKKTNRTWRVSVLIGLLLLIAVIFAIGRQEPNKSDIPSTTPTNTPVASTATKTRTQVPSPTVGPTNEFTDTFGIAKLFELGNATSMSYQEGVLFFTMANGDLCKMYESDLGIQTCVRMQAQDDTLQEGYGEIFLLMNGFEQNYAIEMWDWSKTDPELLLVIEGNEEDNLRLNAVYEPRYGSIFYTRIRDGISEVIDVNVIGEKHYQKRLGFNGAQAQLLGLINEDAYILTWYNSQTFQLVHSGTFSGTDEIFKVRENTFISNNWIGECSTSECFRNQTVDTDTWETTYPVVRKPHPVFSPDGNYLAYAHETGFGILHYNEQERNYNLGLDFPVLDIDIGDYAYILTGDNLQIWLYK